MGECSGLGCVGSLGRGVGGGVWLVVWVTGWGCIFLFCGVAWFTCFGVVVCWWVV